MKKKFLTNDEIMIRCAEIANDLPNNRLFYGVPRGGIAPAYAIATMSNGGVVDNFMDADYIVDDLIDSGETRAYYMARNTKAKFIFLYDHTEKPKKEWLVFPWEVTKNNEDKSSTDIFVRLLQLIGEDPTREGLLETPVRMEKMYSEITAGYREHPASYFKTFREDAATYDEMIMLDPIPFFSLCEHHLAPFFGHAFIAYIPDEEYAGISKFGRVVNTYSRRLQIQERLTNQIAETIATFLKPRGVAVVIRARHLCMEMRGLKTHDVYTTTSSMRGVFMSDSKARSEFLQLIRR